MRGLSSRRAASPLAADNDSGSEGKLYGLWDAIWFGLEDSPACSNAVSRQKSTFTADPLDNVIPAISYAPLLTGLAPNGLSSASALPSALLQQQQQVAAAAAAAAVSVQEQLQQPHQQPALRYSAVQAAPAAAIPAQPRAVWVPSGGGAAGGAASRAATHADSSPATPVNQQQPQEQLQLQQPQQDEHQQANPAPFVLGTWAQRQYIMPLQRPAKPANSSADADPARASAAISQRGSSSPARPIPKGKYPSSNGSSHSSGASIRAKAAPPAAHSSSGASSEAVPATAAQEAAAAAEAAAAGAEADPVQLPIGDDAAAVAMWQTAADAHQQQRQQGQQQVRASLGTEEEEEMVQQIAWRWRFARRWQAEQTRGPLDPAAAASPGDGGMEEALQYLAACGENWHHMSRESSHLGTMESRLLGTLGSVGTLGAELLADDCGSFSLANSASGLQGALLQGTADSSGPLAASCYSRGTSMTGEGGGMQDLQLQAQLQQAQDERLQQQPQQPVQQAQPQQRRRQRGGALPRGEATVQVSGITRRAQQLLEAQNGINQAAEERWREVSAKQGTAVWVGALLEGVQVDPWGKFKFLLLRIRDRNGRQVLLVRGANNASEGTILEELQKQVMAACSAHDLPSEPIEVVGGGIMEWTQHRDRHLHISGGYVSRSSGPGGPSSPTEVMRLAAVLTQQVLPMHYKVTSDAG